MGQRYRKMEDQKPGLPCNQNFAKGGQDLNQNLKFSKNCNLGKMESCLNLCNLNVTQTRVSGQSPRRWAIFCNVLEKIAILRPFGSHFAHL